MESYTEIQLTPKQKALKKYYEKKKNDPAFIERRRELEKIRRNNPEYVEKQRLKQLKYYHKIKDDMEYKEKVANYKRDYWIRKKENNLLL